MSVESYTNIQRDTHYFHIIKYHVGNKLGFEMLSWSFTERLCYFTLHFTCVHTHLTCSENGTIVRKKLLTLSPIKTTFGKKGKGLKTLLNHSE